MTRARMLILLGGAAVTIAAVALIASRRSDEGEEAEVAPTALVSVAPVRRGPVQDSVSAYGVVQADATGTVTVPAPRAAIVLRMLVRPGQPIALGAPVAEIANAPASEMAYRQAANAAASAKLDLARVQRLFDQRLAANDQLIAARKTLADAQAALAAQTAQGSGRTRQMLVAPTAGVVTNVAAAAGDHLAQDAPIVTIARAGAAVAKLALEPSGGRYMAGQPVIITPSFGGPPLRSRLTMVGRAADPATRTIDAIAAAPGDLPVGAPVKAEVVTGSHEGLLAPRASVVFDETGPHVFVVQGGRAHRVFVQAGADRGETIEISGPLPTNAAVAVEGAYELQDGMAVRVRGR